MSVYVKYLDSQYHTDGDSIVGPCSMNWALGYQRVSANPVAIVTADQLTPEQLTGAHPGDIKPASQETLL